MEIQSGDSDEKVSEYAYVHEYVNQCVCMEKGAYTWILWWVGLAFVLFSRSIDVFIDKWFCKEAQGNKP